jgi:hypothetical protein
VQKNIRRNRSHDKKHRQENIGEVMSSLTIFYGLVALLLFGFLAIFMTPVFQAVVGNYDPQVQLIIMAIIPIMSIAILFGVFGGE